jgi:hypothetical protein
MIIRTLGWLPNKYLGHVFERRFAFGAFLGAFSSEISKKSIASFFLPRGIRKTTIVKKVAKMITKKLK